MPEFHASLNAALARNSGPSAEDVDLAAWLRDWRLADCEHAEVRDGGIICCSPCLRDRILASDWLAAHTAAAKREGARAVLAVVEREFWRYTGPLSEVPLVAAAREAAARVEGGA